MKKLLATFLSCCLATALQGSPAIPDAQSPNVSTNASPEKPKLLWAVILVLSVVAAGGYVIVKVSSKFPDQHSPVTLVLEKSYDNATWIPVVTNTVTLNGQQPLEFFREAMTDNLAMYRAHLQH